MPSSRQTQLGARLVNTEQLKSRIFPSGVGSVTPPASVVDVVVVVLSVCFSVAGPLIAELRHHRGIRGSWRPWNLCSPWTLVLLNNCWVTNKQLTFFFLILLCNWQNVSGFCSCYVFALISSLLLSRVATVPAVHQKCPPTKPINPPSDLQTNTDVEIIQTLDCCRILKK